MKPRKTAKQRELMGIILREAGQGRFLSIKELHELISYEASYGAIRISVRWLERQGMLERRQAGRLTMLVPTQRGYDWFRPVM